MTKKLTFKEYISDYQIVSVQNEDLMDKLGCLNIYNDWEKIKTVYLIVFKNGGFIQCLDSGKFYLEVDRGSYEGNDWKLLATYLYKWADGEYFDAADVDLLCPHEVIV